MKYRFALLLLFIVVCVQAQITPADGLWGTADNPVIGSGLMLATQDDTTVISVFTYDDEGNNVWYIASGQVDENNVLESNLLLASNGSNILHENPVPAEFIGTPRTIRIEFIGSQIGTISINGSTPKVVQASHFGFDINQLIHDLSGQWLLGSVDNNESYVLDLEWVDVIQAPTPPVSIVSYKSVHPSTNNWSLTCYGMGVDITALNCYVARDTDGQLSPLKIHLKDLGTKRMTLINETAEPVERYQAFRLNNDRSLLPNDGYWRPADDPVIGSGIVMRTQGEFTVVLVYTYDISGKAKWQIASGQFDETGKLVAAIMTSNNGSAIESNNPTSATFIEESGVLEIQLLGTELATFSIDGSTPKYIQNLNFGIELISTEQFSVNDDSYKYPNQVGSWVMVDEFHQQSQIVKLETFDLNSFQSPPDPRLIGASQYRSLSLDDAHLLDLFCINRLNFGVGFEMRLPYCYGQHFMSSEHGPLKMYYEDIGVNEFRYYISEVFMGGSSDHIDRNSKMYQLYRLSED